MDTQNYKRTLAGSVGAGVGALMGASGKTYFILEHKTSSKYHQAGESQKIIVDQVELGRAASCQVRFDESFETVSRRHAAIERDGENWKLIHLSQSNPTLVNGQPVNGTYYLQSGDEIQLSVGGPRLGFIVPQGRQALTSSIGMTERLNLFRKQALRPYKNALIIMGIVFVLAVAGLMAWNYNLGQKNELLADQLNEQTLALEENQMRLDSLGRERAALIAQQNELQRKIENNEGDKEALKAQLDNVSGHLNYVNSRYNKVNEDLRNLQEEINNNPLSSENGAVASSSSSSRAKSAVANEAEEVTAPASASSSAQDANASSDLKDYYDYIYTIKIDRIEVEYNGRSTNPGIQLSEIVCGTGFLLDDGTFVTDRQNVEPWIYSTNAVWKEGWRKTLAQYVAAGSKVIIHYLAYSTKGTGKPLSFTNADFVVNRSYDTVVELEADRDFRKAWEKAFNLNFDDNKNVKRRKMRASVISPSSQSYAYIRNKGTYGEGIPYDKEASVSMSGGTEIHMVGYAGHTNIHNPVPAHFNDRTNVDDTQNRTIILQNSVGEVGYYGSPAFVKDANGNYKVVGVMVGSISGKDRLVPIKNVKP